MFDTDGDVAAGPRGCRADRVSSVRHDDPAAGLSVLHVVVKAGPTNSQYHEHCLPVRGERRITVCSLFPADVPLDPDLVVVAGDGSLRGCWRSLRSALDRSTYDVVHAHAVGSAVLTLAVYAVTRRPRRDLVFTFHTSWPNVRARNRALLYVVAAMFPLVVACGEASRDSLPRGLRRLVRRLEVVSNGVDVDRVDRVLAGRPQSPPPRSGLGRVVTVGRPVPVKDTGTVVRAFRAAASSDDTLVVVGDAAPEDLALGAGASVEATGLVPRETVYEHLHAADLFVSASLVEGIPVAVLEAMACRCPVVLSDIPAHREVARSLGVTTVPLVPPGDVAGFAREMRRIAGLGPAARLRLGEDLRRAVREHHDVGTMNRAYGRLYAELAAAAPSGAERPDRAGRGSAPASLLQQVTYAGAAALVAAGAVLGYTRLHPPTYRADVTMTVHAPAPLTAETAEDLGGSVADVAALVGHEPVLAPVARRLGSTDWRSLRSRVRAVVGPADSFTVVVSASGASGAAAERLVALVADRLRELTAGVVAARPDPRFLDQELARVPVELDAVRQRLVRLMDEEDAPGRQRRLTELRSTLAELQTTRQSLLEWRSDDGGSPGLRLVDRTSAREAPPLPPTPVLTVAAAVAGACAWAASEALRRRSRSQEERP